MKWTPASGETVIYFDPTQRALYLRGKRSAYSPWRWVKKRRVGRNRGGCFPEVVARAHFEQLGYKVLLSDPKYPKGLGYLLLHYRQLRLGNHAAFRRMQRQFLSVDLNRLAETARAAKLRRCNSGGGGDPDLFVFKPDGTERFFVEVKHDDELHCNQLVCFPLIERDLCEVKVVRVAPLR